MRYRLAGLAVLFVCLFTLSACTNPFLGLIGETDSSSTVSISSTALTGTSWKLTQLTEDGKSHMLVPTAPVTLHFQQSDATYIGSSGCNYYNGTYTVSGNHLNFKFQGVTQKGCVSPIMSQEVAYLNAMEQVRAYQIEGQTLMLKDDHDTVVLVFTAA